MSNIRSFREEPNIWNKLAMALAYLVLGWVVAKYPPEGMGDLMSIFLVLGILVWAFIIRRRGMKYFIRYHVAQALLLNLSLAAVVWLIYAVIGFLSTMPGLNMIAALLIRSLFENFMVIGPYPACVENVIVMGMAAILAGYVLAGKYTELPWITDGVRYWI